MPNYAAIDLGAESGRVMLGRLEGRRFELEEVHRFPNGAVRLNGSLRWDVLRIWEEIQCGLHKLAQRGVSVASVGVDSWALDYVRMTKREPVLRPPFCYRDARTEAVYSKTRAKIGDEVFYEETGLQFMPINTVYHLVADWDTEPEVVNLSDRFLMIGDWFHYLMSGNPVQEESNASTTQLWNPVERRWSEELISKLGLPRGAFPQVVPPCSVLGNLTPELQQETGLGAIHVVAGCVHDTGAAVAAVPAADEADWAYLSSGTWSLIGIELAKPLITAAARESNFTNETGVGGTSRFLRNASGLWILQECRRAWARGGLETQYDGLTRLAHAAEPFRSLIDADDMRFLRADDMPSAIRQFCKETGQPEPESPGEFVRCTLESLALLYAAMLEMLESVTGRKITTLHIVGGGSKNEMLNQMTADASGKMVLAGPVEATAIGNALLQALALGDLQSHSELRQVVRESFPLRTFKPSGDKCWAAARTRFKKLRMRQ